MTRSTARHVIEDIKYGAETIWCICGALIEAEPDPLFKDRHEPLVKAWNLHRIGDEGRARTRTKLRMRGIRTSETP